MYHGTASCRDDAITWSFRCFPRDAERCTRSNVLSRELRWVSSGSVNCYCFCNEKCRRSPAWHLREIPSSTSTEPELSDPTELPARFRIWRRCTWVMMFLQTSTDGYFRSMITWVSVLGPCWIGQPSRTTRWARGLRSAFASNLRAIENRTWNILFDTSRVPSSRNLVFPV